MDFKLWEPRYRRIVKSFGFNPKADRKAAEILAQLLEGRRLGPEVLERRIRGGVVMVLGRGPSLEEAIPHLKALKPHPKLTLIAADGATTPLLREGVMPDVIVTDLDGRIQDLLEASRRGAVAVIHAHGDNIPSLRRYVGRFEGGAVGTTQTEPVGGIYNFGGFTDGDRAVFMAVELGARVVVLGGMDFGRYVTEYSADRRGVVKEAGPVKRRKLLAAKRLLEWLASWSPGKIMNLPVGEGKILGVEEINWDYLSLYSKGE